jgi:hypothetical protein
VVDRGYYTYNGPSIFLYVGGHPLPGGGWCFLAGPHHHEYFPPPRAGFVWHRGYGYYYEGVYRPNRPPPPAFWPRPVEWHRVPPSSRLPTVPAPVYRPPRASPSPSPRGSDRFDDHDRRDDHDRFNDRNHRGDRDRFDDRDRRGAGDRLDDRNRATPPAPPPSPARDERDHDRGRHGDSPKAGPAGLPAQQVQPPPRGKPGVIDAVQRAGLSGDKGKERKDDRKDGKDKNKDDKQDDKREPAGRPIRPSP